MDKNIVFHNHKIARADRHKMNSHGSKVIWLTGLSGSGKSTLASDVEQELWSRGIRTYVLDGDNVRSGLNSDLGFTDAGREENIRRIGEVAALLNDAGMVVITAFISPFKADREKARNIIGIDNFVEVFINTPLDVCESRDPKGLYEKARSGQIKNFTGIDSAFEVPDSPDIVIENHLNSQEESCTQVVDYIFPKLIL